MSVSLARCLSLVCAVLVAGFSCAAESQPCAPESAALWQEAWRIADLVESPIDAGRTKIELAASALQTGCHAVVRDWLAQDCEGWVKGSVYAYAAATAALDDRAGDAQRWLGEAQRLFAAENEWRQLLMESALASGKAALILKSSPQIGAGLRDLQSWVGESQEERQKGAAWALAEWLARRANGAAAAAMTDEAKRVGRAFLELADALQVCERATLVERAARGLAACGLVDDAKARLSAWMGPQGMEAVPVERYRLLTCGAGICAACGEAEQADSFWALARERAKRDQTGEEKAPWALLAEAADLCGRRGAAVESLWLEGLGHAVARPGYHRRVAVALTLGGMAAYGTESAGRDISHVIAEARQIAGVK